MEALKTDYEKLVKQTLTSPRVKKGMETDKQNKQFQGENESAKSQDFCQNNNATNHQKK